MTEDDRAGGGDTSFEAGFARVVRPLAAVMVHNGMTIAQATEALKQAMLAAALARAGETATDSQLSLLTGLHRKDVRRLRGLGPAPAKPPAINAAATVLAIWAHHPAFQDKQGASIALRPRGGPDAPGFDDLVKAARVDLPPATVLAYVLEAGAVRHRAQGDGQQLELVRQTLGLEGRDADRQEAYVRNIEAHLAVAAGNMTEGAQAFERALHVNQLSDGSLEALRREAEDAAQQMLERLNRRALELQERDRAEGEEPTGRFALGAYVLAKKPEGDN